ncbi:MAK10-like protein [Tanacetum coccineum]|uniref:MAK10-like protein n=1 Tax=Tanacetum coccineum TaxID=301880 RepID=A0ABQ5EMZ3_9ASTR
MAAHSERMKKFEEAIYEQREEINERMTKMFSLLKEYTKGKSPEKVLVREEVSKPITKYVNAISLVRIENDKDKECDEVIDKQIVEPIKFYPSSVTLMNMEDVLEEVAGFVYPMDFVILDIKEDDYMPLILGTPFLITTRTEIKCDKGSMTLKAGKFKVKSTIGDFMFA